MAENPTSSSTTYRTFGAPSGAIGCVYGPQSGVESLMSMLTTPLNGPVIGASSRRVRTRLCHASLSARPVYRCHAWLASSRWDETRAVTIGAAFLGEPRLAEP